MIKRGRQRTATLSAQERAQIDAAVCSTLATAPRAPRPSVDLVRIDSGDGERQRERRDRHDRPRDPNKLTLREGLRSLAHRNRRQLYPWLAMLAVAVAGLAASFVGWLTGADALTGQVTTAACAIGVGVLLVALMIKRVPMYWASWLTVCAANATAWISTTAAYGFDYPKLVWLYASTALLGLRWWPHVRHPHAADPASVAESNSGAHLAQDWADNAACSGGPAPGTRLTGLTPYEHGYTGDVLLVRGRQSLADIQSALPRLSTALDVAQESLIIEAHPNGPPSRLRVQIVTRSPIKTAVYFDQPVYRNGRILLGPYADGLGDASFVLYTEDSMECGYVLGSKGSGKSRVLETVALSAVTCTPTVIFYVDGQNGASSPLLWDHALWRSGPDKADTVLRALLGIKDFRQLYNRRFRLPGFTPSAEMPASSWSSTNATRSSPTARSSGPTSPGKDANSGSASSPPPRSPPSTRSATAPKPTRCGPRSCRPTGSRCVPRRRCNPPSSRGCR